MRRGWCAGQLKANDRKSLESLSDTSHLAKKSKLQRISKQGKYETFEYVAAAAMMPSIHVWASLLLGPVLQRDLNSCAAVGRPGPGGACPVPGLFKV